MQILISIYRILQNTFSLISLFFKIPKAKTSFYRNVQKTFLYKSFKIKIVESKKTNIKTIKDKYYSLTVNFKLNTLKLSFFHKSIIQISQPNNSTV